MYIPRMHACTQTNTHTHSHTHTFTHTHAHTHTLSLSLCLSLSFFIYPSFSLSLTDTVTQWGAILTLYFNSCPRYILRDRPTGPTCTNISSQTRFCIFTKQSTVGLGLTGDIQNNLNCNTWRWGCTGGQNNFGKGDFSQDVWYTSPCWKRQREREKERRFQ